MPLLKNRSLDLFSTSAPKPVAGREGSSILKSLAYLAPCDRSLIELAYKGNLSCRQMGRALGLPSGTVSRRIRRLAGRLQDPLVIALLDRSCPLRPEYRQIGIEYFLHGKSVSALSEFHQLKRGEIHRMLEYIRGWHRGLCAAQSRDWRNVQI